MILLVDDETFALSLLQRKLTPHNLEILTATSVHEAIAIIEQNDAIQLVITDLHMPNSNGFELLEWLYSNAPQIKTIVTTAHSMDAKEIEKSHLMKCDIILIKPISVEDELYPAIRDLLD